MTQPDFFLDPEPTASAVGAGDEADTPISDEAMADGGDASGDVPGRGGACPYLVGGDGGWRSTGATRDHRCAALDPPTAIALDKQRRLCLVGEHRTCPTFAAARSAREQALGGIPAGWEPSRPIVRTTPVVVEAAPRRRALPLAFGSHRLAEGAVAILGIVVVVLVGSRLFGEGAPERTPRPTAPGALLSATLVPSASDGAPGPTAVPADSFLSPTPPVAASPEPTQGPTPQATPTPSTSQRTYTVKGGDTLSGIAARFGVTWQALARANKLKSPYRIVRGQVLVIPAAP